MKKTMIWSAALWMGLLGTACGRGCGDSPETTVNAAKPEPLAGNPDTAAPNKDGAPAARQEAPASSASNTQALPPFTTDATLPVPAQVKPSIPLPANLVWRGIAASAFAQTQQHTADLARDDNLLTAWTCDMSADQRCVYTLKLDTPAEICAIRLFATTGASPSDARRQGFTKTMRVHTEKGRVTVSLQRRFNYQYVVFPQCVSTGVVSLEAVDFHLPPAKPVMALAEIELLGTGGTPRPPLVLDSRTMVTVADGSFWVENDRGCNDCVYQGSSTTAAWMEQADGKGNRSRLFQGHRATSSPTGRFLLVEKTLSEYCPGATAHHKQQFTLVDTRNRTMYLTPFATIADTTDVWELAGLYANRHSDTFAVRMWSFSGEAPDILATLQIDKNQIRVAQKNMTEIASVPAEEYMKQAGFENAWYRSLTPPPKKAPELSRAQQQDLCRKIPLPNGTFPKTDWCEQMLQYQQWQTYPLPGGRTLVFTTPDICMLLENDGRPFAAVLDQQGAPQSWLSDVSITNIQIDPNGMPMIEVLRSHKSGGVYYDFAYSDIYILDATFHFKKAYPGAAFTLPTSPGCLCSA